MEYCAEVEHNVKQLYSWTATGVSESASAVWLVNFSNSVAAWTVFPSLLHTSTSQEVRFYSANALYSKVRSDWPSLSQDQREGLVGHLWGTLDCASPVDTVVQGRLSLALAAATVQTQGALPIFFQRISSMISLAVGRCTPENGSGEGRMVLFVCLSALCAVAELSEELQLPPRMRDSLKNDLITVAPGVHDMLAALVGVGSLIGVESYRGGSTGSSSPRSDSGNVCDVFKSLLRCASAWVSIEGSGVEFFLAATRNPALLLAACDALGTLPHSLGLGVFCAGLISASLERGENVGLEEKRALLCALGMRFLSLAPVLVGLLSAGEENVSAWSEALSSLLRQSDWAAGEGAMVQSQDFSSLPLHLFPHALSACDRGSTGEALLSCEGAPLGISCLLGDLVIQCAAASHPSDSALWAFEFINYTPTSGRHPFWRAPAHAALVKIIASQCIDLRCGGGGVPGSKRPDLESWLAYRNVYCCDTLSDCARLLGPTFFFTLFSLLNPAAAAAEKTEGHPKPLSLPLHFHQAPEWAKMEAVLHCLSLVAGSSEDRREAVESIFAYKSAAQNKHTAFDPAPPPTSSVSLLLASLIAKVTSWDPSTLPPELSISAARWLGGVPRVWLCDPRIIGQGGIDSCMGACKGESTGEEGLTPKELLAAILSFLVRCCITSASSELFHTTQEANRRVQLSGESGGGGDGTLYRAWWMGGKSPAAGEAGSDSAKQKLLLSSAQAAVDLLGCGDRLADAKAGGEQDEDDCETASSPHSHSGTASLINVAGGALGDWLSSFSRGEGCVRLFPLEGLIPALLDVWTGLHTPPLPYHPPPIYSMLHSVRSRLTLYLTLIALTPHHSGGGVEDPSRASASRVSSILSPSLSMLLAALQCGGEGQQEQGKATESTPYLLCTVITELSLFTHLLLQLPAPSFTACDEDSLLSHSRSSTPDLSDNEGVGMEKGFGGGGWFGGGGGGVNVGHTFSSCNYPSITVPASNPSTPTTPPGVLSHLGVGGGPTSDHPLLSLVGASIWNTQLDNYLRMALLPPPHSPSPQCLLIGHLREVSLMFYKQALRCFGPLLQQRLHAVLQFSVWMYSQCLSHSALTLLEQGLLSMLLVLGEQSLHLGGKHTSTKNHRHHDSPILVSSSHTLLSSVIFTTSTSLPRLQHLPDTLSALHSLFSTLLRACPSALMEAVTVALPPLQDYSDCTPPSSSGASGAAPETMPLLQACLKIFPYCVAWGSKAAVRAAVSFLKELCSGCEGSSLGGATGSAGGVANRPPSANHVLPMHALPPSVLACVNASLRILAGPCGAALGSGLARESGEDICSSVVDAVCCLARVGGGVGELLAEGVLQGLEGAARVSSARLQPVLAKLAAAGGGGGDGGGGGCSLEPPPPPATGILCMSSVERRGVVHRALSYLWEPPGRDRQCRRMLLNFADVCRKKNTKDILL